MYMYWNRAAWLAAVAASLGVAWAAFGAVDSGIGIVFLPEYRGAIGNHLNRERELRFEEDVFAGETVKTGPGGSTALQFLDETRIQIGANSTVVLDEFVFDPNAGLQEATLNFGTGIFRIISNGSGADQRLRLRTPTAVLAIRGTKFILEIKPDGGTVVGILEGSVAAFPCGGEAASAEADQSLIVDASCTGTKVVDGIATSSTDPAVTSDISIPADGPEESHGGEKGGVE